MRDFLSMGGYALYVWGSFGFATIALVTLFVVSWWQARKLGLELAEAQTRVRAQRRRAAAPIVPRRKGEDTHQAAGSSP